jgi:signal transduction histidine kinase
MAIDRRRFLALPAIGVPAIVVGKRLGILAWLKSYFSALRGVPPTEESIAKSFVPLELDELERAHERARVGRELHDGAVQALIAIEMQVDVVRRQAANQSSPLTAELGRIQGLLREEVLKLRELMQQMNSLDVDSSNLLQFLLDTVERFQRETGISARFMSELDEVKMPQRVCRELVRIVQEGLVRVRRHNGTREVLVRMSSANQHWRLTIEDNGRGFPFAGRFLQTDLEEMGKGPIVIRERVRLIGGELTVESSPSRGSRLVVTVPQRQS